jgi:hypothetical protein
MAEFSHNDPAMFDHINNALVGELPSFGMAKESKFQQLMQRSQSQHISNFAPPNSGIQSSGIAQSQMNSTFDTSLSVEAKAFQPVNNLSADPAFQQQISTSSAFSSSAQQPNPGAREFIPRNLSTPSGLSQMVTQNGGYSIPEFIPSRQSSRISSDPQPAKDMQQVGHTEYYKLKTKQFVTDDHGLL